MADFYEPDEELEEEGYNIFDEPEEVDLDELLSKEFVQKNESGEESDDVPNGNGFADVLTQSEEKVDIAQLLGGSDETESENQNGLDDLVFPDFGAIDEISGDDMDAMVPEMEPSEIQNFDEPESVSQEDFPEFTEIGVSDLPEMDENEYMVLDELFHNMDDSSDENGRSDSQEDQGLEELFAVGEESSSSGGKKPAKEKKSFWKSVFGNVPVDPSKVKPELTPEQIAAKKQKKKEQKQKALAEKKEAATVKKEEKKKAKEEKAREKKLAKEEKKAKKMKEAKQILEEMQDTRINRVGATIVFLFFAVCAVGLIAGSDLFGYAMSVKNAEKKFALALDNDVKYYNDAYNDIYGLNVKPEDQELNDKIMTVMFVNKELNSYNSYMLMEDYESALHALLMGLYRYGKYYDEAVPLGIDRDMDFVRKQILKELSITFDISEDAAEVLRSKLELAMTDKEVSKEYSLEIYEIVRESGLDEK